MKKILICLFFLSILVFNQCKPGKKVILIPENGSVLRLADLLTPDSISETPFFGLEERFPHVEEDLTGKGQRMFELSTEDHSVWAFTTGQSILGLQENRIPQNMTLKVRKQDISFRVHPEKDRMSWSWIKTDREIDIKYDQKYNRFFNCLILEDGHSFTFTSHFPDAAAYLSISARRNWHPMLMEIRVDGALVQEKSVSRQKADYVYSIPPNPGTHQIEIRTRREGHPRPGEGKTPPRLLVYQISVRTVNDIILLSVPDETQINPQDMEVNLRYQAVPDREEFRRAWLPLFKWKEDFQVNSVFIKKKITTADKAMDILMAPPISRFRFNLKIPEKCFLETGIGINRTGQSETPQAARFRILIDTGTEQKTLYDEHLYGQDEEESLKIEFKKFDLSFFAGQAVTVTLQTDTIEEAGHPDPVLAFWYNPILYQASPQQPNIILISLDTLRADHVGCYGYRQNTTPNLDGLSEDCVLFENVYAQSPWTLPSHLSLLFSLNSASHRVHYSNQKIHPSTPSLASLLKDAGYLTNALTGGGYVSHIFGFAKGFDWYDDHAAGGKVPLIEDEAERLMDHTADWLKNNTEKRFFLFLHTFQLHDPYSCPAPWSRTFLDEDARWERMDMQSFLREKKTFSPEEITNVIGLYDGEIRYTDEKLIKPLIALLKELDLYENSMIIITSDHGEEFNDHSGWLHGQNLFDESLKVPLLIKFPKSAYKGTKVNTLCRLIDVMPTVLESAGIPSPKTIEGKSLFDLITRKEKHDRTFISDLAFPDVLDPSPALMATNNGPIKFIFEKSIHGLKNIHVYNLENDPDEKLDLFRQYRSLAQKQLKALTGYYKKQQKERFLSPDVDMADTIRERLKALGYIK